jgi:hypothetical protein
MSIDEIVTRLGTSKPELCTHAVILDNLWLLEKAHNERCFWGTWATIFAARGKTLKCFKYLHENKCPMDCEEVLEIATVNGKYDILEYILNTMHIKPTKNSMDLAIGSGDVDCIRLLIGKGLHPDEDCIQLSTKIGNLECVQYLCSLGFKLSHEARKSIIQSPEYKHVAKIKECADYAISAQKKLYVI